MDPRFGPQSATTVNMINADCMISERRTRGSGGRGELAAGSVDLAAPGVAHGHGNAVRAQPLDEGVLDARVARRPLRAGRGVERDRVDVHPPLAAPGELAAEEVGSPLLVVDVADQGVLDAHPASC